jgi:phage baseplate assembly protein W
VILYDYDVIKQSIKTILSTLSGERVRSPLGASVIRHLFEPIDPETAQDIKDTITDAILTYEPRVSNISVVVYPNYDGNYYEVGVSVKIKQIQQTLTFNTKLRSFSD